MQGSGFTRREIVCWDLNIHKQTWIYVDTTKRGILCKYNHLDVFYYYRIIYVHVKMLDIYSYRPFPFRICISGGSSAVAVGEGEGPLPPADSKSHQSAVHLQRNLAGLSYK